MLSVAQRLQAARSIGLALSLAASACAPTPAANSRVVNALVTGQTATAGTLAGTVRFPGADLLGKRKTFRTDGQQAAAGATVSLLDAKRQPVTDGAGRPLVAVTDAGGTFTLAGVPTGHTY